MTQQATTEEAAILNIDRQELFCSSDRQIARVAI